MSAKRITNEEEYDLLKVIDLEVSFGDEVIYKGPIINEKSEEKENSCLGVFDPNSSKTFKAVATLRDGIGDEYKDKYARVDWLFIAEGDDGNSITSSNQINLGNNIKNNNKTNLPRTGEIIRRIYFAVGFIAIGILLLSSKNDKKKFKN